MAVTATSLGTYLGITDIDTDRATLLIAQSTALVKTITGDPVPAEADAVIYSSVARAYLNPASAPNMSAGPYSVGLPTGGVYLTRAERASLGRLTNRGSHFVIDAIPGYTEPLA